MPKRWREEDEEEEEFDSKWRRAASHFFELEADVDSDEDGDSDDSDAEDDFIDDARVDEKDNCALRQRHVIHPQIGEDEDEEDIEERYGRKSRYEEEEDTIEVFQQALLPTVTDSKLWMVKCAIGHEKEVAAYKESHVREACKGMRNIFLKNKMVMVPIKEMSDVLTVKKREREFSNGLWVRMKRGTYKGDLAQIVNGDDIRRRVMVKLIPRIDFRALVNQFDGIKIPKEEKFCPPARFWSATKAKALGIPVTRQKDSVTGDYFDTVNGMLFLKFKDGLLYKSVSIRSIGYKGRVLRVDDDVVYLKPESEVVSGGKEGATGTITSVKGHVVTVLPDKSINTFDVLADHVEENSELAYSRVPPRSVSIPNVRPLPPPKKGNAYGDVRSASIANFRRPPSPQKKGYDFGRARRDPLLNARIKIRQGLHNGMVGRVVEVRGHRVRVELEAQMNHAYVDRSQIYEIGEADNSIYPEEHYGLVSETPVYCPRTPLRPWMTPARDAPATPIHEGMRTPIRSRAWNPCS
ncbi:putative transcription elongation factor SPT5 -like protein 1 [Capsicum baccatum]|uniref:Transcription elongation factor SPT5-like protein 1 n=1 Tax=Capsicum baccatum TaxID=33114 RepID=A0A2G2X0S4_CAPBA|nr:putative transcription elongation factor SPT5 -like protein 1 [Capsicum baccatum]